MWHFVGMSTPQEMLDAYMAAELAILQGKEVKFLDRMLRYEDLAEIRAGRKEWEGKVSSQAAAAAGVSAIRFATARLN